MKQHAEDSEKTSRLRKMICDFRASWKSLVVTDIIFKVITVVVLTPLMGVLFRGLIAFSGSDVLSDQDILFFILGPVGLFCFVVVGAVWLGIGVLEQASLCGIVATKKRGNPVGTIGAIRFAFSLAWPIVNVTSRIVAICFAISAPFLGAIALIYFWLLGEFDINFYLQEKPPVFIIAVIAAVVLVLAMSAVLLRFLTGWLFALPLVLFEGVNAKYALRESSKRAPGHRRTVVVWVVCWSLAISLLSAIGTGAVGLTARLLVPNADGSLALLTLAIGSVLFIAAVVNLAVNLISTTSLATLLFSLYEETVCDHASFQIPEGLSPVDNLTRAMKLTRPRVFAFCIAGLLLSGILGAGTLESVRMEDDVLNIAHRGSSFERPENTKVAIEQAIDDEADWVEIDVQETADGEVVVFHDSDFKRLGNVDLKIWDATMEDLKHIDIRSRFKKEYEYKEAERVQTLGDVLEQCRGRIGVNIELKYYGHDKDLEKLTLDIIEEKGMESEVMLMSLKMSAVKKLRELRDESPTRPNWMVGQLMSVSAGDLKKLNAEFIAVNAAFVDRKLVRAAHRNDMQIYVWTVDDAPTMSTMIGLGVDGILTNRPKVLEKVLTERADMSVPERLLLEFGELMGVKAELGEQ